MYKQQFTKQITEGVLFRMAVADASMGCAAGMVDSVIVIVCYNYAVFGKCKGNMLLEAAIRPVSLGVVTSM